MREGLPLPPGAITLQAHASWKRFSESVEFQWPVSHVHPMDWDLQAPHGHPVATFSIDDGIKKHRIGLFVQIELTTTELQTEIFDGAVVFRCPPPSEGQLRTQQDAMQYLVSAGDLIWHVLPDYSYALSRARANVESQRLAFVAEQEAEHQARAASLMEARKRMLSMSRLHTPPTPIPAPESVEMNLPTWAAWKKRNTSFFGFGIAKGECWVVMAAEDIAGCYIVPIPLAFEGWEESLPPGLGAPMPSRECYTSTLTINELNAWFMPRAKLGLRIDSDARVIERFAISVCGNPE
jgi:hypothetical protein